MDLSKFLQSKPLVVKVTDAVKDYIPERKGYWKLTCVLESGDETFIVLSQAEVDSLPPMKEDYAEISSVARVSKWTKNGKSGQYLERLVPLPPLKKAAATEWKNPFIEVKGTKKP